MNHQKMFENYCEDHKDPSIICPNCNDAYLEAAKTFDDKLFGVNKNLFVAAFILSVGLIVPYAGTGILAIISIYVLHETNLL